MNRFQVGSSLALGCMIFGGLATKTIAQSLAPGVPTADLKPIALRYEDVPRQVIGKTIQPAYQKVWLDIRNVGNQPVISEGFNQCLSMQSRGLTIACSLSVIVMINGQSASQQLGTPSQGGLQYVPGEPSYDPAKTYTWQFQLPAATLKPCDRVSVALDTQLALTQYVGDSSQAALNNDRAILTAWNQRIDRVCQKNTL